jgi:hypothetical protein
LNENKVNANDDWKWQNVLGNGPKPTSTLTLTHTGSAATARVSIPVQLFSTVPTGIPPFFAASTTVVPNLNASYVNGNSIIQLTDTPGDITVNPGTCTDRTAALAVITATATITVSSVYALEANLTLSPARAEAGVGAHYRICNVQSSGHIVLAPNSTFVLKVIQ